MSLNGFPRPRSASQEEARKLSPKELSNTAHRINIPRMTETELAQAEGAVNARLEAIEQNLTIVRDEAETFTAPIRDRITEILKNKEIPLTEGEEKGIEQIRNGGVVHRLSERSQPGWYCKEGLAYLQKEGIITDADLVRADGLTEKFRELGQQKKAIELGVEKGTID